MPNYSFYDAFSPIDFERFCRDVIQVREGISFELTKIGKDKGIDFKHKSERIFIVGQAKKYKYYKDFIRVLKHEELKKVKKLKPDRYIITTSLSLTNSQVDEIYKVFDGIIISKNDILGKNELNELLSEESYHAVERKHTKLWISSSNILQNILDETVYRRQYNLVYQELDRIKSVSKYYVQNLSFDEALSVVENENYVIISGTAGSGKTTLGRMLILYFMEKQFELVMVTDNISQAEEIFDTNKKQIFFFDDFLGSFQFDEKMVGGRDLVSLNRFIDSIQKSKNKLLILTTREYILRRGQTKFTEQLNNKVIDLKKCIVDASKYTRYEKAEILFNHLYYSEIDLDQIVFFKDKKYYNDIIAHSNYSPRLIEDATSRFNFDEPSTKYEGSFYIQFKNYLDDPYSYWQTLFEKQSIASQLLLLNLFISCEPLDISFLKLSFDNTCKAYKKQFDDLIITPNTFRSSIKELSDTFLTIEERYIDYNLVCFQNPSINDFLLKYLRERQDLISILIEGAVFWNQLIFVFTTQHKYNPDNEYLNKFGENIDEIDDERYISGESILLSKQNSEVLLKKSLRDFDKLKFGNLEKKEFTDEFTIHNSIETIEVSKLRDLSAFFDVNTNQELRDYIVKRVEKKFFEYQEKGKYKLIHDSDAMQIFPFLIRSVKEFLSINSKNIIELYLSSITYSPEYFGFKEFEKIYPEEYKEYITKHISSIRKDIRNRILYDLDSLDPDEDYEGEEIDKFFEYIADELFKDFGMKMTKKFKNEMEFNAFDGLPRNEFRGWESYDKSEAKEEKKRRKQELKKREKEEKEIKNLFNQVNNEKLIDGLVEFKKKRKESDKEYFERVLDLTLNDKKLLVQLEVLAFKAIKDIKDTFSNEYLAKHFNCTFSDKELTNLIESINPIIIENNNRYSFGNSKLRNYLGASYIVKMTEQERKDFLEVDYIDMYFEDPDFHEGYWQIWNEINPNIFAKDFVQFYWIKFKNNLDYSNKTSLFKSVIKYSEQEVSVGIDKELNEMECLGGSVGGGILWHIFEHYSQYDIFDISSWYFDSYRYEDDENLPSFFTLNKKHYPELKRYVLENFESREYNFMNRDLKEYNISLNREIDNKYALGLFLNIGMVDTVFNLMQELELFFDGLTS